MYKWQYQSENKWKDYDNEASTQIEIDYQKYISNQSFNIKSYKSGIWEYLIDFPSLKQSNIQKASHKVRNIRRVPLNYSH